MQVKEVEIGGVFALDRYENVRVVIRATVSDEELGRAVDWLCDTVEKVADIARAVRRWTFYSLLGVSQDPELDHSLPVR